MSATPTTGSNSGSEAKSWLPEYLERNGYKLIARNVRRREGEIDLIATRKRTLVFVEVKLRSPGPFDGAI